MEIEKNVLEAIGEAVGKAVSDKMDEIKATVAEQTKGDEKIRKTLEVGEKSILKTERVKAPFVKLGSDMENFCNDMKAMMRDAKIVKAATFNETTPADGGYTVPEELEASIISYAMEESIVRSRATIKKMKSDTYKINKLDQSANSYAGVSITWLGEGDTTADEKFDITQLSLIARKMMLLTTESREIISDSNIDFANYVVNIFGQAAAYGEDYAFLRGNGSTQPLGIVADTNIQVINRAVANQVSYQDIIDMFYKLKPVFRKNAVWLGHTNVIAYVDGLKDKNDRPIWVDSIQNETPPRLKGKPFIETEKLPDLGTKGDLILGDLSWYYIGDREGITIDASIHDRFRYDEITIRLIKRVDGKAAMKEAFVILDVPSAY